MQITAQRQDGTFVTCCRSTARKNGWTRVRDEAVIAAAPRVNFETKIQRVVAELVEALQATKATRQR